MAIKTINRTKFYGGISFAEKVSKYSYGYGFSKNMDMSIDPSYITAKEGFAKVSGSEVTGLVTAMVDGSPYDTNKYFYDLGGKIYRETSAGAWSTLRTVSGGNGSGLEVFDDYMYYTTPTTLGRYGKLSTTPAFNDDFLTDGTTNLDQFFDTSGQTYTLATSINEGATHRQTIVPSKDPIKSIQVNVGAVGTGDWTLTLHDSNNVSIGSVTIANGSMATGDITFTFSTACRIVIGNEYHFHITSTVADGAVVSRDTNDLETCDFHSYFGILIDSTWHSMIKHLNGLVVLNDDYLAYWDRAIYDPNKVALEKGFKAHSVTKLDGYVVVGAWKGDSIDNVEEARLYFWDGILPYFNFSRPVPMGLPNALHVNSDGDLLGVYGRKGTLYLGASPYSEVQDMPKLTSGKYLEVYPHAMTEWDGKTYIGVAGATDDATGVEQGVYEYGSGNTDLPSVLTFPFTTSEGETQDVNVRVGSVRGYGKYLYSGVAYSNGSDYGVERVTLGGNVATSGTFRDLLFDNDIPSKNKLAIKLIIYFTPLIAGDSITPQCYINRSATPLSGSSAVTTAGATKAQFDLESATRFREIEWGFDWSTTNTTFPKILSVYFEYDDLSEERVNW